MTTTLRIVPPDPAAAERARKKTEYRHLIDDGGAILKGLKIRDINGLIAALLDLGWLDEAKSEDRKAQVAALGAMVDDYVSRHRVR